MTLPDRRYCACLRVGISGSQGLLPPPEIGRGQEVKSPPIYASGRRNMQAALKNFRARSEITLRGGAPLRLRGVR
jgi:hypothetical protein